MCSCAFQCGELRNEEKRMHFIEFYKLDYNSQSAFLAKACIKVGDVNRRRVSEVFSRRHCTPQYFIPRKDTNVRVCRKTLCDVFNITPRRVQMLLEKIKFDKPLTDGRGLHDNRPNRVSDETRELIKQHISSFPLQENHYSRLESKKKCLNPNLTVKRMWKLFLNKHPDSQVGIHMYRDIFNSEFNLRFGLPRSDTCAYCDRLYIQLIAANDDTERRTIEVESRIHHARADLAYSSLAKDTALAENHLDTTVVLCVDLQQVLFCPNLTHNNVFYQRQLSCYNLAVHNAGTNKAMMFFWDETIGKRGSAEVASCILKYITLHFSKLMEGETRRLVIWSDRCVGQNNNWRMIALLQHLVLNQYFSCVEQKFMTTGHSFLPCDRDFALIERAKKGKKVYIPFHFVEIIANAKDSNQFQVNMMEGEDFKNIDIVLKSLATAKFNITDHVWYQITTDDPITLRARISHNILQPWISHCLAKKIKHTKKFYPPVNVLEFPSLYTSRLGIKPAKKKDLDDMCQYIPAEFRGFYESIEVEGGSEPTVN